MGQIFAFANNRGGCGKTTVTINLAVALAKLGKQVLVVDMDAQCNATTKLRPISSRSKTVYDILSGETIRRGDILPYYTQNTPIGNVSVLPCIPEIAMLEFEWWNKQTDFSEVTLQLRNALQPDKDVWDYIFIDTPPNLGPFTIFSLCASDKVIVPIWAGSADSVAGLGRLNEIIQQYIEQRFNTSLFRFLLNNVDRRTTISLQICEQARRVLGNDRFFKTEIPVNTSFERAEAEHLTIFEYDPTAAGTRAFRALARELVEIIEPGSTKESADDSDEG